MPKVSNYELDRLDEEISFEKVRRKNKQVKDSSCFNKNKRKPKKVDYGDLMIND